MAGFIDQLIAEHGDEIGVQLSQQLGLPKDTAAGLLPQLAPMILGGLQRQAVEHGPERVDHILDKHADEGILGNLGDFLKTKAEEPDDAVDPNLGGLLGNSGAQASDLLSNQLGLSKGAAAKIIPMIAPIILGALMKQRNTAGGAGSGTSAIIGFLDQDGDGSILDDVAGMLLKGNLGGGTQSTGGGGLLSKVLGGILGGRR